MLATERSKRPRCGLVPHALRHSYRRRYRPLNSSSLGTCAAVGSFVAVACPQGHREFDCANEAVRRLESRVWYSASLAAGVCAPHAAMRAARRDRHDRHQRTYSSVTPSSSCMAYDPQQVESSGVHVLPALHRAAVTRAVPSGQSKLSKIARSASDAAVYLTSTSMRILGW